LLALHTRTRTKEIPFLKKLQNRIFSELGTQFIEQCIGSFCKIVFCCLIVIATVQIIMSAPSQPIQLAGHVGAFTKLDGGRIRKLVKKEEAGFYKGLAARNLDADIAPYIPKFFGIEEHDGHGKFYW
jgi:hypothetical protein